MSQSEAFGVAAKIARRRVALGLPDEPEPSPAAPEGYEPMATAPRDRSFVIVKIARYDPRRKYLEQIARWDPTGMNARWRGYTVSNLCFRDNELAGWRPMDEAAWQFVKAKRERARKKPTNP